MNRNGNSPNGSSGIPPFPMNLFFDEEFKLCIEQAVSTTKLPQRFTPRIYSYADFIFPKLYAEAHDQSVEIVTEDLNERFKKWLEKHHHIKLKIFADGKRHRRAIPHQTEVDKFFRRLTEKEIQQIFGQVLMEINKRIKKKVMGGAKVRFYADNTQYPYYGNDRTSFEIKGHDLPGTKYCRMIQGHQLYSCGISLFTDFFLLQHKKYRGANLRSSVSWIKFNGFNIAYACLDREFYRVSVFRDLKHEKVMTIEPAKKYGRVRNEFKKYLFKQRPISTPYLFTQTAKQYPMQSSTHVNLVLVGHDDEPARDIREKMWQGTLTFDEAMSKMAGFFTTLLPWKNPNAWARWLTSGYKGRWNIETGTCKLNAVHESFRYRFPMQKLCDEYLRAIIYNHWQFNMKWGEKINLKSSRYSLKEYKIYFSKFCRKSIYSITYKRIKNDLKNGRNVYT